MPKGQSVGAGSLAPSTGVEVLSIIFLNLWVSPIGCMLAGDEYPVVSLRSITGYSLRCLRHRGNFVRTGRKGATAGARRERE